MFYKWHFAFCKYKMDYTISGFWISEDENRIKAFSRQNQDSRKRRTNYTCFLAVFISCFQILQ